LHFDYGWDIQKCLKCQSIFNKCKKCKYTGHQEINVKDLIKYTCLPELWAIFNKVINISPLRETGFSLELMDTYLKNSTHYCNWSQKEFWDSMEYFLNRINIHLSAKREHNRKSLK